MRTIKNLQFGQSNPNLIRVLIVVFIIQILVSVATIICNIRQYSRIGNIAERIERIEDMINSDED